MLKKQQKVQFKHVDFEVISQEEYQNQLADRVAKLVFDGEENAEKAGNLIAQFVASYEQHKNEIPLNEWLTRELGKYPSIWQDAREIEATSHEIIAGVQKANTAKELLYAHLEKGKSRESWIAQKIEEGAAAAGVTQVGRYAKHLDQSLSDANLKAFDAIFNKREDVLGDWEASASPHMHGFIAEVDVANQFNLNASAGQSGISAEVLGSTGLNSADLVIRDATGKVLQLVQVKSYADVSQAVNNIRSHGYKSGTTLLVHEDQVERLQREFPNLNVTGKLEAGGVSSNMPSYQKLKEFPSWSPRTACGGSALEISSQQNSCG